MIQRFFRINKNLYRGSAPSHNDIIDLHKRFGIKKIVSLDKDVGKKIDRLCILLGIEHVIIPIDADKIEPMANLLNMDLHQLLMEGGPTFVHCIQGKDRTGMVIAMYDCKYNGISCEEAIEKAKVLGFGIGLPPKIQRFYERAIHAYCDCPTKDKDKSDSNEADIVDYTRQLDGEWHDSYLDEADRKSFAPSQDPNVQEYPFKLTVNYGYDPKTYPYTTTYDYAYDPTMTTREQQKEAPRYFQGEETKDVGDVMVGIYDNDAGIKSIGPVELGGGFVSS